MGAINNNNIRNAELFNTPLEVGARIIFTLAESKSKSFDLQRLIYYDYLILHTSDVNGPESLHPAIPNRAGEIAIKRKMIQDALVLLNSKELIEIKLMKKGVLYTISDNGLMFVKLFESDYAKSLKERISWVCKQFNPLTESQLHTMITKNLGDWGSEFHKEDWIRGDS